MKTLLYSEERFFSFDLDEKTGNYYLTIPLSKGAVDYEESYLVDQQLYLQYPENFDEVESFLQLCRDGKMFHLKLNGMLAEDVVKRGVPWYPKIREGSR